MTVDPYVDPDHGVLRNRLGITDPRRLQEAAIHPFREGNGRTQRAFFGQLSRDAGWPIDWSGMKPGSNASASASSVRGDNHPLHALIDSLTAD